MNLKMPALRFSVDGKHFDNGAFQKQCHHDNRDFAARVLFKNKIIQNEQ